MSNAWIRLEGRHGPSRGATANCRRDAGRWRGWKARVGLVARSAAALWSLLVAAQAGSGPVTAPDGQVPSVGGAILGAGEMPVAPTVAMGTVVPPELEPLFLALVFGLGGVALVWIALLLRQVRRRERAEATTRAISQFATSLLEQHTEEDILWDLAKNCVAGLGFQDCVVYLRDASQGVMVQTAAHGPKNPGGRRILQPISLPVGQGIVGTVAATGRAEIIADTRADPRYVVDDEFRLSEIAVPIVAHGEVLGVIDSEHPEPDFFTAEHLEILTAVASICANKLVRARAEMRLLEMNQELERRITERTGELQQANDLLRAGIAERERAEKTQKALLEISEAVHAAADLPALYERIHAIIGTLMRADNFYLALLDETTGVVSFPYFKDLIDAPPPPRTAGRGMTEYVLRTGRPTLANLQEIQRLKAAGEYHQSGHASAIWLGVPLTLEGRTFGVMAVQHQDDPEAFGEEEKRILTFVAGQTALAIVRKRQEEELHRSTRRLRESEERFGKAFRSVPAVLSIIRMADERIIEVNEAFLAASGYARDEVLGRTTSDLGIWADLDERAEFLRRVRQQGFVHAFEARLQTARRQEEIVLMSAETIELNGERCLLALSVVVTARKRAEEELLRSLARERSLSELKSRFVSMVSHEFRTPLGIILSSAEILESYLDRLPPDRRQEHLRDIAHCARQMAGLMEEVLVLSRAEAGKLEFSPRPLNLVGFCQRIVSDMNSSTGGRCAIRTEFADGLEDACSDDGLLRHILTNLLSNAVKYSPAGAVVELALRRQDGDAVFTVADHGIGIPEADTHQMFEAFHRGRNVADTPGSGLGLMIVKHCVELHQGRISFETQVGRGTTFQVVLPVFRTPPSPPSPPPPERVDRIEEPRPVPP